MKITYVLSNINRAVAFEWITELLDNNRFELSFVLLNKENSNIEDFLIKNQIPVKRIRFNGKKDILRAIVELIHFYRKNKTEIVHCHLFEASLIGITAAWLAGIKKRIYTRHFSTQHHTYFPSSVKYDRLINRLSTDIVAISKNVRNVLIAQEQVDESKIHLLHHGFMIEQFDANKIGMDRISMLSNKYDLSNKSPVIGVIARFIQWKGIQDIIPAFKKLLTTYPEAVLVLANANGNYSNEINKMLSSMSKDNYRIIEFEIDIFALYQLFDVFVHVPIDSQSEAFGQTYVEALASRIPAVFTLSGVANEFIVHEKNALVVPYQSSESIYDAIKIILSKPNHYLKMVEQGHADVMVNFQIATMIKALTKLYES